MHELATYNPTNLDFWVDILKLKKISNPQIGLFMFPEQMIAFLRQARELGLKANYFGIDLCETAAMLSNGSGLLDGCLYSDNDVSPEFRAKYRSTFKEETLLTFAGSAYDQSLLIADLLGKAQAFSAENFLSAMSQVSNRPGVLGKFSYQEITGVGKFFEYPIHVKKVVGPRGVAIH